MFLHRLPVGKLCYVTVDVLSVLTELFQGPHDVEGEQIAKQ